MVDIDSWVASAPSIAPNSASMAHSPARRRPFRPGVIRRQGAVPGSPLIPYSGYGANTPTEVPPADVEASAKAQEAKGFTLMAAGASGALAGAAMKNLPVVARLGMALGGTLATVLGVKALAEAEATRQAGLKVGVVLAECMAQKIIGGSKIPF